MSLEQCLAAVSQVEVTHNAARASAVQAFKAGLRTLQQRFKTDAPILKDQTQSHFHLLGLGEKDRVLCYQFNG